MESLTSDSNNDCDEKLRPEMAADKVTEVRVITILEQINTQIISQTTEYSKWKGDIGIAINFRCAIRKPVPKRPPLAVKWEKPNQHMDGAKLNIDGCCKRELGIMAGGGIIRDGKG
ncbi:Uncharacterized protein Fot_22395 [Forsythia ovata]|uniref:Uncharacterized protein n=1 Tax=Forsythia ovata TaxID=205694 RepID=A0ABD1UXK8_9LAMI